MISFYLQYFTYSFLNENNRKRPIEKSQIMFFSLCLVQFNLVLKLSTKHLKFGLLTIILRQQTSYACAASSKQLIIITVVPLFHSNIIIIFCYYFISFVLTVELGSIFAGSTTSLYYYFLAFLYVIYNVQYFLTETLENDFSE